MTTPEPSAVHSPCRGLTEGTEFCHLVRLAFNVGGVFILTVGTVGNVAAFLVVGATSLRRSSTAVYLQALAAVDSLCIWAGLGRHVITSFLGVDVRELSSIVCKVHVFVVYSAMNSSVWILVCISVERYLAACRPMSHRAVTRGRALVSAAVVVVIALGFNFHVFFTRGNEMEPAANFTSSPKRDRQHCGFTSPEARLFWNKYLGWLASVYSSIVPFIVMLALNVLILRKLRKLAVRKQSWSIKSGSSSANGDIGNPHRSLTVMLLSATMFFLFVTAPAFLVNTLEKHIDALPYIDLKVADTFTGLLLYLGFAINFYIYLATGRRFRADVLNWLKDIARACRAVGDNCRLQQRSSETKGNCRLQQVAGGTETFV